MYRHERSLVKRLADEPFALIGVNSDKDREKLKKVMQENDLTWRSFWDNGGTSGPIAKAWNVLSWPRTFVLDHKGVIRFKKVKAATMDRAVDSLLAEMKQEAAAKKKGGDDAGDKESNHPK